jgi:hypothetical protein
MNGQFTAGFASLKQSVCETTLGPQIQNSTRHFPLFPIEQALLASETHPMKDNTPPAVARGKVFAVAPMLDGADNTRKSIAYETSCAPGGQ